MEHLKVSGGESLVFYWQQSLKMGAELLKAGEE